MMTTIVEGAITFTFPAGWRVIKYDETQFYRNHIEYLGAALKGVDILASRAPDDNALLVIEVKDFRGHAIENRKRQTSGELEQEIIQKLLHTFSALYITAFSPANDLKSFCAGTLMQPASVVYVLLMEEDRAPNRLQEENSVKNRQNIELRLKGKLKSHASVSFKLLNIQNINPRDGWNAV